MKLHKCCSYVLLAAGGIFLATSALSADKTTDKPAAMDPQMAEMMKKCEIAGMPGPAHKTLEQFVGSWKAETKCFMPGSDKPEVSKGKTKAEWILGNRYVQEEFTGEFMGKPFHGIGITGYDNTRKQYTSVWIDDMSTVMFTSVGNVDDSGKVFTFEGKMTSCPMSGEKDKPMKMIVRLDSPDKHIFEMHDPSLGDKSKQMEIVYTRK